MSANLTATVNGTQKSGTTTCNFNPTAAAAKIGQTFALCLLFVVSLTGNSLIGLIVYKTKTMRKPINFFIVNMALSDLLYPIFHFPWMITEINVGSWLISGPLGQALCKLAPFLRDVSLGVSTQSLVPIAVDRFVAVVFPFRSPVISTKPCRFFIPASSFYLTVFIVLFYIPLVLIAILHLTILLTLKSQKIPGEQSVNAREQRVKRERNVLKMSIAIVLVFAICWLPFTLSWLLLVFPTDDTMISSCAFWYFRSIFIFLAYSNCAINPYICFIFSGNYRQGLKNLLSCWAADTRANQVAPA